MGTEDPSAQPRPSCDGAARPPAASRRARSDPMKYVMLIHSDMALWEQLPKEEADRVIGNHYKLIDEPKASGEMIRVDGLSNERTFIEFRDGTPAVTDGPFGEVKEQLAGVFRSMSTASIGRRRSPVRSPSTASSRSGRLWRTPGRRCDADDRPRRHRGPAPRARAAGPCRARAAERPVRRLRGRRPGGTARGRRSSGRPTASRTTRAAG